MVSEQDNDDANWLQALAGQADPTADNLTNQQAAALRRALQAQSADLNTTVPQADEATYQQLLFRLRREGLVKPQRFWSNPALWGLAATVTLVIGVVVQMGGLNPDADDANTMRGGNVTVLIVQNPEARLAELLGGLKSVGAEPTATREPGGRILITVKVSPQVLDYLGTQRIEPTIVNGIAKILLSIK